MGDEEKTVVYDGVIPIEEPTLAKWYKDGVTWVRISYVNDLDTVIWYSGMDECNNHMDELVGVSLMDLSYGIDYAGTAQLVEASDGSLTDSFVMFVEGEIDWYNTDFDPNDNV